MLHNKSIPSVGIIGEGSAKIAHYLLAKKKGEFSIIGFDSLDRTGGHIHSIAIPVPSEENETAENCEQGEQGEAITIEKISNDEFISAQAASAQAVFEKRTSVKRIVPEGKLTPVEGTTKFKDEKNREFYIVEGGAEFINPSYIELLTLFKDIGVTTQTFSMTMAIHELAENKKLNDAFVVSQKFLDILKNFQAEEGETGLVNLIKEFFKGFDYLFKYIALAIVINKAHTLTPSTKTVKEFIKEVRENWFYRLFITDDFINNYLYPLLASAWGVKVKEKEKFLAHYSMNYLTKGSEFIEVKGGLSQYIEKLDSNIQKDEIKLNTKISKVEMKELDGKNFYHLYEKTENDGEKLITDEDGSPRYFSDLIVSTPAEVSKLILAGINDPDLKALVEKLGKVRYFDTTICFCKPPKDIDLGNSEVVNISTQNNEQPYTVVIKDHLYPGIAKMWVHDEKHMPKPEDIYAKFHYRHPHMDIYYKNAQDAIVAYNAKNTGIQFAGILAGFDDSHTSAAYAAGRAVVNIHNRHQKNESLDYLMTNTTFVPVVVSRMELEKNPPAPKERASCCC